MNIGSVDYISYSKMDEQFKTDLSSFIQENCYNIEGTTLSRPDCYIDGTVLVDSIYYDFDNNKIPFKNPSYQGWYWWWLEFPQDKRKGDRFVKIVIDDEVLKLPSFNMVSVVNEFDTYMIKNLPDVLTNKIVSTQDMVNYYNLCNYFLQKRIVRMIPPPRFQDDNPKPSEYIDMGYFYSNIDDLDIPDTIIISEGSFSNNGIFDNYGFILNAVNIISNIRTVNCKLIQNK